VTDLHEPPADENARYLRSVVRVFPDYAGTVLWFVGGPVDYAEAAIGDDLAADMRRWEAAYYDALGPDLEWPSPAARIAHAEAGLDLARRLSDELGDAFEVEVFDARDRPQRLRGRHAPANPRAVAAFRARVAEDEALTAQVDEMRASGARFEVHGPE
jgi:hypothetical protein